MRKSSRKANLSPTARPQMEVYDASYARSGAQSVMPSPVTSFYCLVFAGSITGLAYFIGDKWFDGNGLLWSMIAIGVMTVVGIGIIAMRAQRAKGQPRVQGEDLESALRGSSSGWDDSVADPAEIARQDELRNKFLKGIQVFRDHERDFYSMPWYVIVGEPGSGKTQAISRSELRFPEHLHEALQGTGGTYSMDWWFTSQAIILDTAGAMLMQPEAAARFESFLKLLSEHRPACPINGMILTIPTDSLLSDPPHVTEQKARVIATQLSLIQKTLDVRFPIFLMISKSDRMPGFREFFDMEGQSKYERQMMGWANPAPLGSPFSPDAIYTALDTISRRLRARALALLQDPLPQNPGGRRADEVDAMFGFPSFIRSLAPRLKLYLDVIFQTGAWATKPPFFRGVFFTTAMREGAQLDIELARSLGVPPNQLSEGIFERKKSAFLRDLFLEKIFPEEGLVTRLFDVGSHLRKRLTTFYAATALLLALALGFAWMVKDLIETRLGEEQTMWANANSTWQNGTFLRVIGRSSSHSEYLTGRPAWYVAGSSDSGASRQSDPVAELAKIKERVTDPIGLSWVFYPVPEWRDFLERRQLGYLTLFEGAVMKPVLDAARERLLWDVARGNTTRPETQLYLAAAYKRLVELETWLANDSSNVPVEDWERWFLDLLLYITDPAPPGGIPRDFPANLPLPVEAGPDPIQVQRLAKDLAARAREVYGSQVALSARKWMSEPGDGNATSALAKGADFIFSKTRAEAASNDQSRQEALERKKAAIARLHQAEKNLLALAETQPQGPRSRIEAEGMRPLKEAISEYRSTADSASGDSFNSRLGMEVVNETAKAILEAENGMKMPPDGLQYAASLARKTRTDSNNAAGNDPGDTEDAWIAATKRLVAYDAAFAPLRSQDVGISMGNSVGRLSQRLSEVTEYINSASQPSAATQPVAEAEKPGDPTHGMEVKISAYLHRFRGTPLISEVFRNYEQELRTKLQQTLRFPLVQRPESYESMFAFESACNELGKVEKDMENLPRHSAPLYQCQERSPVEDLFRKLEVVASIKTAILSGLKIEVDAVEPAKTVSKQTEVADPAASGGFFSPGVPRTSVTESIQEGFINIKIVVAGSKKADGPPNGTSKVVEYDGFGTVEIALTFARPPPAPNQVISFTSSSEKWPLLRVLGLGAKNRFPIGNSGKVFILKSSPSLPIGQWPDIKEFMPR